MSNKDPWALTPSEPSQPNPWDSWESEPPRATGTTGPIASQQFAESSYAGNSATMPAKKNSATVLWAILGVVALALVGAGGYLAYSGQLSSIMGKSAEPEVVTITETVRPSAANEQSAISSAPNPPVVTTVVQTIQQPPATAADSNSSRVRELPADMYEGGWRSVPNAQCSGNDKFQFAGRSGGNYVLICSGSNGNYYQGWVDGGAYRSPINASKSNPGAHYYVVPADPATIIVTAADVRVEQNGSTLLQKYFQEIHDSKY